MTSILDNPRAALPFLRLDSRACLPTRTMMRDVILPSLVHSVENVIRKDFRTTSGIVLTHDSWMSWSAKDALNVVVNFLDRSWR